MTGNSVWSVIFTLVVSIAVLFVASRLVAAWYRFAQKVNASNEAGGPFPPVVGLLAATIATIGIFILVVTLGWNAMVRTTTTMSTYKSPAETQEQQKVMESKMPTAEELDQARDDQKQRQVKTHKEALDAFDQAAEREAKKIKQRSLGDATPVPVK